MKKAILFALMIPPVAFGSISDIATAISNKVTEVKSQISDKELLSLLRSRYQRDIESGDHRAIEIWHGKAQNEEPDYFNKVVRITFADGTVIPVKMKQGRIDANSVRNKLAGNDVIAKRKRLEQEMEKIQKQIDDMKAGVPLKALETRLQALKNSLSTPVKTNIATEIN